MPIVELLEDGEFVGQPVRAGGAFDPYGARGSDVKRAADMIALVDAHPGRWVLVTLTVDRSKFLSPAMADLVAGERVREVARRLSLRRIHFAVLELQSATGEGWPHWHLMIWAPDGRSRGHLKREALKAWRVKGPAIVQDETGDVETPARFESIGFVDVQLVRDRKGAARYTAGYCLKPWRAIPGWMLRDFAQRRKLRPSVGCYDWWESVGRHERQRGQRPTPTGVRSGRRPRRLIDRMASSCRRMAILRRGHDGRLCYCGSLSAPCGRPDWWQFLERSGAEVLRAGKVPALRWRLPSALVGRLLRDEALRDRWAEAADEDQAEARAELETAWCRMQEECEDRRRPRLFGGGNCDGPH